MFSRAVEATGAAAPLAARVQMQAPASADAEAVPAVRRVLEGAVAHHGVLALDYEDRDGQRSRRQVEPVAFVEVASRWYLLAWCRLRGEARCFRLDRILRALDTGATVPPWQVEDLLAPEPASPPPLPGTTTTSASPRSQRRHRRLPARR